MVDFNNETTVGTPAIDVVRILILQRRADVIEAFELYHKQIANNIEGSTSLIHARLLSLFMELQGSIKRRCATEKDYLEVLKNFDSLEIEQMKKNFYYLNEYLDSIKLTVIDTKKQYDRSNWETDNKENGIR